MSSFDKTVKLACKPKAAPPKAKYLDPIISATYSEDGSVHDVCRALAPRFREPNAIVVFKALIVLHTMIRNGATDNVLSYLSTNDVLRLHNVSTGQWEGYNAPQNLQHYAMYLDTRIRIYKDLKHDPVRVQSEQNRDMRIDNTIEEDKAKQQGHARSKTLAGRKLRVMTVEKGLLRETKAVQKALSSLLDCRLYLEDLGDELNITALRMLVKDLLVLFQAVNEGVINVLEHYFEMSHVDAKDSLNIYRHFCKQAEQVVEYFSVAKKLQNLLNVPIPNLKHAPVSLAGALEEYLNDPNFEQNRLEYRTNNAVTDKATPSDTSKSKTTQKKDTSSSAKAADSSKSQSQSSSTATANDDGNKALVDFFSAIEEEQSNMFNPKTGSPTSSYFQQQAAHNPFHRQQALVTGSPFTQPVFAVPQQPQPTGFVQTQPTGFILPQVTSLPAFPQQPFQQPFQQQLQPQTSFLRPQPTGFLQPQATGPNPFRQSMLLSQTTGFPVSGSSPFGTQVQPQANGPAFAAISAAPAVTNSTPSWPSAQQQQQQLSTATAPNNFTSNVTNAFSATPARPASTPVTRNPSNTAPQPVTSHQTGSRNPFGIPKAASPPPVPKAPTLFELTTGAFGASSANNQPQINVNGTNGLASFPFNQNQSQPGTLTNQESGISNVASSFIFNKETKTGSSFTAPSMSSQTKTSINSPDSSSLFSRQFTGTTTSSATTSSTPSISLPSLQPQTTGFAGIKQFKPTSSFGATLLESLPPIPQSSPSTPAASTNTLPSTQPSGSFFSAPNITQSQNTPNNLNGSSTSQNIPSLGAINTQPTGFAGGLSSFGSNTGQPSNFGSSLGVGLRPQTTGLSGAANPFRASMLNPTSGAFGTSFSSSSTSGQPNNQPSFSQGNLFGSRNFSASNAPQQNGFSSLI